MGALWGRGTCSSLSGLAGLRTIGLAKGSSQAVCAAGSTGVGAQGVLRIQQNLQLFLSAVTYFL